MKTTAIYADASGPEERAIASRMWMTHAAVSGGARPKAAGGAARRSRYVAPAVGRVTSVN